ncbi:MAG: hypothetical protein R6V84_17265 [Desulfobacterales bacterium]
MIRLENGARLQLIVEHLLMDVVLKLDHLCGLGANDGLLCFGVAEQRLNLMPSNCQLFPSAQGLGPELCIEPLNGLSLGFGQPKRLDRRTAPAFRPCSPSRPPSRHLAENDHRKNHQRQRSQNPYLYHVEISPPFLKLA